MGTLVEAVRLFLLGFKRLSCCHWCFIQLHLGISILCRICRSVSIHTGFPLSRNRRLLFTGVVYCLLSCILVRAVRGSALPIPELNHETWDFAISHRLVSTRFLLIIAFKVIIFFVVTTLPLIFAGQSSFRADIYVVASISVCASSPRSLGSASVFPICCIVTLISEQSFTIQTPSTSPNLPPACCKPRTSGFCRSGGTGGVPNGFSSCGLIIRKDFLIVRICVFELLSTSTTLVERETWFGSRKCSFARNSVVASFTFLVHISTVHDMPQAKCMQTYLFGALEPRDGILNSLTELFRMGTLVLSKLIGKALQLGNGPCNTPPSDVLQRRVTFPI